MQLGYSTRAGAYRVGRTRDGHTTCFHLRQCCQSAYQCSQVNLALESRKASDMYTVSSSLRAFISLITVIWTLLLNSPRSLVAVSSSCIFVLHSHHSSLQVKTISPSSNSSEGHHPMAFMDIKPVYWVVYWVVIFYHLIRVKYKVLSHHSYSQMNKWMNEWMIEWWFY